MHLRYALVALPVAVAASFAFLACVGSDATAVGGGSDDAGAGTGSDGGGGPGSGDGAATGDDAQAGDAGADAGPICGYPGEDCCTGPFSACNDGLTCDATAKKCLVNDFWVVGSTFDLGTFGHDGISAHYDGTKLTIGPGMAAGAIARGVWGDKPGSYWAVNDKGKINLYTAGISNWLICGSFGCDDPNITTELNAITGFGVGDFWVSGPNTMFQCNGSTCAPHTAGLTPGWGEGNLSGTSSTDLWFSQFDKAYHYDGTSWTPYTGLQARVVYAHAPNDVWVGDTTLQHWDGHTWSPTYAIDGAPAPGNIYAIGGSATDNVIAVGYDGADGAHPAFSARWDGASWKKTMMPADTGQVGAVWVASKIEAWAVSFDGGVYKWDGAAWSALAPLDYADGGAASPNWEAVFGSARPR